MAKNSKIILTEEQLSYLTKAVAAKVHPKEMAQVIGVHVDTLKRILDRNGLVPAFSEKHMASLSEKKAKCGLWQRPCMKCKSTKPRPVNQYVCDACKRSIKSHNTDGDYVYN